MDVNLIEEAQIWKQQYGENKGDNIKVFGVYNDGDRTHTSLHSCLVGEDRVRDMRSPKDLKERSKEDRVRGMRGIKYLKEISRKDRVRDMGGPKDLEERSKEDRARNRRGLKDLEERSKEDGVRDTRSPKVPQERSKGERMRDMRGPKDLQGDEEWQVPMQKDENGPEDNWDPKNA